MKKPPPHQRILAAFGQLASKAGCLINAQRPQVFVLFSGKRSRELNRNGLPVICSIPSGPVPPIYVSVAALRPGEPYGNLLEAAEAASLQAKQGGRNRLVAR